MPGQVATVQESVFMPTLEGEENRYLLRALQNEAPLVRRVPGNRYSAAQRCWLFPRQPGVVLALDRVFGESGWQFVPELEIDVADARQRQFVAPQSTARVELDGSQLTIQCTIGDRELVKLVPGYRWSPAQKRWFVAALPLARDVLQERFGRRLVLGPGVEAYIHLRREEELRTAAPEAAPAQSQRFAPVPAAVSLAGAPAEAPPEIEALPPTPPPAFDSLREAVSALAAAVARIDEKLDRLLIRPAGPSSDDAPQPVAASPSAEARGDEPAALEPVEEWRTLLFLSASDPLAALDQANRLLQTTDTGDAAALRAVAGIAAARAGQTEQAWGHVSRVTAAAETSLEAPLAEALRAAYVAVVLQLINDDCGPVEAIESEADFARLINAELVNDEGFGAEAIGSEAARGTLDLLVNDRGLRRAAPCLSDYCRIAHLLATARGGTRMAAERVASVLREGSLSPNAGALGIILFANVCMQQRCVVDWVEDWPAAEHESPMADGSWLVHLALDMLPQLDRELASQAALAVLGCIASGPAEQATLSQRRELVHFMPQKWPFRRQAEFLAMFRLAATGERLPLAQFGGYAHRIANAPLERSAAHLTEVYLQGSGVKDSAVKVIADESYLQALAKWGVHDPEAEVLDLLDMLSEGSKPDNVLNALAAMIEDRVVRGTDRFSRPQRKEVYRRALAASLKMGHDGDAREAFDRLVRELRDEGAASELRNMCAPFQAGLKALRIPALIVLLDGLLEDGAPFDEVLNALLREDLARSDEETERPIAELTGLAEIYPQLNEPLQEILAKQGVAPTVEVHFPDLSGKRAVFIGGHQWLKKRALPVMRDRWKLEVEWLEPREAKNGPQLLGLVAGSSDLVVINTRCISHAASGRAKKEAEAAGTRWVPQDSHGVGSLLTFVRGAFAEMPSEGEKKPRKVAGLKRRTRR